MKMRAVRGMKNNAPSSGPGVKKHVAVPRLSNNALPHPGWHIHELHHVKFGGEPVNPANMLAIRPPLHYRLNTFWLRVQKLMEGTNAR